MESNHPARTRRAMPVLKTGGTTGSLPSPRGFADVRAAAAVGATSLETDCKQREASVEREAVTASA